MFVLERKGGRCLIDKERGRKIKEKKAFKRERERERDYQNYTCTFFTLHWNGNDDKIIGIQIQKHEFDS